MSTNLKVVLNKNNYDIIKQISIKSWLVENNSKMK